MKKINLPLLFLFFSVIEVQVQASETEAVVIEVRKNIALSKNDKVLKNYFINGGEKMGLKKGSHVDVLRRVPFHDPLKNISIGDIRVKVAELEIIQADSNLSVAKMVAQESVEDRPVLDYDAVMVGDRLDLNSVRTPLQAPLPDTNAIVLPVELQNDPQMELPGEKVALLSRSDKAKRLMKEGEKNLETLANLKMGATNNAPKSQRQLASVKAPKASKVPKKKK